jgi:putative hydrolase of HD superfamily
MLDSVMSDADLVRSADAVVQLGRMALAFGRVDRITYHEDGVTAESDTDHTVMLGLVACAFAAKHFPCLDLGLVAQFALVHDLVEVYAGDTPTLHQLTERQRVGKADREHRAWQRIDVELRDLLPWVPDMIARYEARDTPEARFVKAMDKVLPKITHLLNGRVTLHQRGVSFDQLVARYGVLVDELRGYAADFPALIDVCEELIRRVLTEMRTVCPA